MKNTRHGYYSVKAKTRNMKEINLTCVITERLELSSRTISLARYNRQCQAVTTSEQIEHNQQW